MRASVKRSVSCAYQNGPFPPLPCAETAEGLEHTLSLRYYSRMRFIHSLLPLLEKSPAGRAVSILAPVYGEASFHLDDLDLKSHSGLLVGTSHASLMTSLTNEELAARHPSTSFVHVFPGMIWTPSVSVGQVPFLLRWLMILVGKPIFWLFGQSYEECGDRMLFLSLTSQLPSRDAAAGASSKATGILQVPEGTGAEAILVGSDGDKGSGAYCIDSAVKRLDNEKRLKDLKAKGAREIVWDHTMEIFSRIDSQSSPSS